MRSLSRTAFALVAVLGLTCLAPMAAFAAESASSDIVIISEGRTVSDDLYASGLRIVIEGEVDGDLVAIAGEEVVIRGRVTGNVTAIAPNVILDGSVDGSLRLVAQRIEVTGLVGRDLVFTSVSTRLGDQSTVTGDLLGWAWDLSAHGEIGDDLTGTFGFLRLAGAVGGDVAVSVRRLLVTGPLEVAGDLGYRSSTDAVGMSNAEVGGVVVHEMPLPPNIRVRALGLLGRVLVILTLTMTALLIAWGWPGHTETAFRRLRPFWKAFGLGLTVFGAPVVVAALGGLVVALAPAAAALPLLALLAPLTLALLGVVVAVSAVAGIPVALALGDKLPGERGMFGDLLAGSLVMGFAWLLPVVGWLVPVLVLPWGLGGWALGLRGAERPRDTDDGAGRTPGV